MRSEADETTTQDRLLERAARLSSLARNGLHFSKNPYDLERYEELLHLAAELSELAAGLPLGSQADLRRKREPSVPCSPPVSVRGFCLNEKNEVLLVRESADGKWCLPGGIAEVGYSPRETAEKEFLEETGKTARATRFLGLFSRPPSTTTGELYHWYDLHFEMEIMTDGTLAENAEITDVGFFPLTDLPPLSVKRTSIATLERLVSDLRHNPGHCD